MIDLTRIELTADGQKRLASHSETLTGSKLPSRVASVLKALQEGDWSVFSSFNGGNFLVAPKLHRFNGDAPVPCVVVQTSGRKTLAAIKIDWYGRSADWERLSEEEAWNAVNRLDQSPHLRHARRA